MKLLNQRSGIRWNATAPLLSLIVFATGCRTLEPGASQTAPEPAQEARAESPDPAQSLVSVSVTAQPALFLQPWNTSPVQRRRGLGVLLPGNRILVSAMLVSDANFVDLQRLPHGRRTAARVVARDYLCNLALLVPAEDAAGFLEGMTPLELDDSARVEDKVWAWQVEDDGSPLLSEGSISRIDLGSYPPSGRRLLVYQFQGTVESRGVAVVPAVREDRLTGLFLLSGDRSSTRTILPAPVIRLFLNDVEAGEPRAFPLLGIHPYRTTDSVFRRYLSLPEEEGGVYVSRVIPESPAALAGLQEGDVLLSFDGHALDRQQYYRDPEHGLLDFSYLIAGRKLAGDTATAEIWRQGERLTVEITLSRQNAEETFVPPFLFDRGPNYVVHGGLVFTELSRPYLQSFREEKNAPIHLRYIHAYPHKFSEGKTSQVVLAYMIPTPANVGYEQINQTPVEEVNGMPIGSIRDLYDALQSPRDGLHAIRVRGPWPVIYLDAALTASVNLRLVASGLSPLNRLP